MNYNVRIRIEYELRRKHVFNMFAVLFVNTLNSFFTRFAQITELFEFVRLSFQLRVRLFAST